MIELYDEYFKTVIDHMHKVFLNNQYINAIEQWYKCSGTKVSHQKTTKDFYIWIYKTGQARENRVCFIYENTREAKHAKKHLESYRHILKPNSYISYMYSLDMLHHLEEI